MAIADVQTAFTAGELSPNVYARVDLAKFDTGAALIRNFVVNFRGGVTRRKGTRFIAGVKNYTSGPQTARLLPFIVATDASYVLEFGDSYIRAFLLGVMVQEIVTPYAATDLALLKYAQSADVMTLVHPSYPPANFSRTSTSTFTYTPITIGPTISPPVITDVTASNGGDYFYGYLVTSVSLDGKQESLPSNIGVDTSEILDETSNRIVRLRWTPPGQPTSRYNIYKWGPIEKSTEPASVWGFIGSSQTTHFVDNNIAPDFSKEPPGWGDPFSGGQFQSIDVGSGGTGYDGSGGWTDIPYVPLSISGDGTGASGWASIQQSSGAIVGVYLTTAGKDYTTATITANGEGGTGATFTQTFADPAALNPATVAYVDQRQVFGGSNLKPETFVMSQPGDYTNFNTTPVTLDSDAIVASISSLQVNTIKSMVPVAYGLLVFTTGGSFLVSGGAPGAPITPSSITAQAQASDGANDIPPLSINYDVLYVQNKGNRVRDLAFAWQRQSYTGSDISTLAAHLFDGFQLTEWCWSQEPDKIVWAVRNDGVMLGLTYVPDQEVYAWSRHDTQGEFKSVCTVPEGDSNAVYVIVRRFVPDVGDGSCCPGWVDYIERLDSSESDCPLDAWYLDCALPLPSSTPASDLCLTNYIPTADPPTVLASVCDSTSTTVLRGPTVSYNILQANGDLNNTVAYFDFTIPADWDNADAADTLTLNLIGGVAAVGGPAPAASSFFFEWWADTADGGSVLSAPLSGSGLSLAVGTVIQTYYKQGGDASWTAPQVDSPFNAGYLDPTLTANLADTLIDGTVHGYAGEGFFTDGVRGFGPVGYDPDPSHSRTTDGTGKVKLTPGTVITVGLYLSSDVEDTINPDRAAYAFVQSLAMTYKGTAYPIDLTTLRVGFSAGTSYVVFHNSPQFTVYPNPGRTVSTTVPPAAHPNFQIWTDFYLQEGLAAGDVIQVGCALLTVTGTNEDGDYICTVECDLAPWEIPDQPVDSAGTLLRLIPAGKWSWATPAIAISGLDHLEGMEVWALADGLAQGPFTVTGGSITLPYAASVVVVGLKFTSQLQTLYLTTEGIFQGSDQGKRKQITGMTVRLDNTKGLMGGTDFAHLTVFPETIITDPCKAYTGDSRVLTYSDWNTNGQVCCETSEPLPAQVLGIIVEVTPGDTGR